MCNELILYEGQSIGILLEKFEVTDDVETPVDFEGAFTFVIYHDPARSKAVMTFTELTGISKSFNEIYISKKKSLNTLKVNEYFASLYNDIDSDDGYEEGRWKIIVKSSRKKLMP